MWTGWSDSPNLYQILVEKNMESNLVAFYFRDIENDSKSFGKKFKETQNYEIKNKNELI